MGSQVVSHALARGYRVRAFCRSEPTFPTHPNLEIERGDIHDTGAVTRAVQGSDAVISCLGSWHTKSKDIVSSGMNMIIPAMHAAHIRRIISLTGSEARDTGDSYGIVHRLMHAFISIVASKVLKDSEKHINILRGSSLDWTVIRSPVMTPGNKAAYTLNDKRPSPWETVSRSSVVDAMLDQLEKSPNLQQSPYLHR